MPGRLVSPLLAPLLGPVVYGNGQDPFYDLDRNLFEWTPNINGVNAWGRFFNAWSPTGPNYEIDIVGFTDVVNGEQAIIAFGGTADGSAFSRDRVGNPDDHYLVISSNVFYDQGDLGNYFTASYSGPAIPFGVPLETYIGRYQNGSSEYKGQLHKLDTKDLADINNNLEIDTIIRSETMPDSIYF